MITLLATRDNQARKVVGVRVVGEEDPGKVLAAARDEYPPPQFETVFGMAADPAMFQRCFPRFADAKVEEGDDDGARTAGGTAAQGAAGKGDALRAPAADRSR